MVPFEITVEELKEWRDQGTPHVLIDVREPAERARTSIGGTLIPLNTIPQRMAELDPEEEIVIYCHSGSRSGMAIQYLRQHGFSKARNLRGGIVAWVNNKYPLE